MTKRAFCTIFFALKHFNIIRIQSLYASDHEVGLSGSDLLYRIPGSCCSPVFFCAMPTYQDHTVNQHLELSVKRKWDTNGTEVSP